MPRISVNFKEHEWKGVRELAEEERDATGRASVANVIRTLVTQRLRERRTAVAVKN